MQMFVTRFASKDPQRQSAMQMFVTRFASKDPRILATADANGDTNSAFGALWLAPPSVRIVLGDLLQTSSV